MQLDQGWTVQSKVELLTACQHHTKWLYQLNISSIFGLIRSRVSCYALLLSNSSSSKCVPLKAGTKPYFKENSPGSIKLSVFSTRNKSSSRSTTHVLEFNIFRLNYIQTYLGVPKLNVLIIQFNDFRQWIYTVWGCLVSCVFQGVKQLLYATINFKLIDISKLYLHQANFNKLSDDRGDSNVSLCFDYEVMKGNFRIVHIDP